MPGMCILYYLFGKTGKVKFQKGANCISWWGEKKTRMKQAGLAGVYRWVIWHFETCAEESASLQKWLLSRWTPAGWPLVDHSRTGRSSVIKKAAKNEIKSVILKLWGILHSPLPPPLPPGWNLKWPVATWTYFHDIQNNYYICNFSLRV